MGIEPFLCIAVFAAGFALQIAIALRDGLVGRLHAGRWMAYLVAVFARGAGLVRVGNRFAGRLGDHPATLQCARFTTRGLCRTVFGLTGVWHRDTSALPVGAPNTVLAIALPTPLPHGFTIRAHGSPKHRLRTGDPVLDQLVRIESDVAPEAIRAMLSDDAVREPLLELMGNHPFSVVTDTHVVVWMTGAVRSLEPVIDLATELAEALSDGSSDREASEIALVDEPDRQSAHANARPHEARAAASIRATSTSGTA
jgi:hypothetical protein